MSDFVIFVSYPQYKFRTSVPRDQCVKIADLHRLAALPDQLNAVHQGAFDITYERKPCSSIDLMSRFGSPN
jgi:hypothetical protein